MRKYIKASGALTLSLDKSKQLVSSLQLRYLKDLLSRKCWFFFFFQAGREGAIGLLKSEVTTFETEKVWQEVGSVEGALPLVLRADYIFFETQEHKGGGEKRSVLK